MGALMQTIPFLGQFSLLTFLPQTSASPLSPDDAFFHTLAQVAGNRARLYWSNPAIKAIQSSGLTGEDLRDHVPGPPPFPS